MVTTNFDPHFCNAAKGLKIDLPTYRAPALPLGHDFQGLVYLHGASNDRPDRLVLTDADFGRAYLSDGWARTFLQGLYSRFHVLFVGYSHSDILLTYLARGLSRKPHSNRYALQLRGGEAKWKRLHVVAIPYGQPPTVIGGSEDHSDLEQGVKRWVEQLRQSPSEELKQVQQIIARTEAPAVSISGESILAPSGNTNSVEGFRLSADDEDLLLRTLREPHKTTWFTANARSLRWIAWAHEKKLRISFGESVDRSNEVQQAHLQISLWALDRLMETPKPAALELFARLGGKFGPEAWQHCILRLIRAKEGDPIWSSGHLEYWLVALRHGCVDHRRVDADFLVRLVSILAKKGLNDHALALFVRMLRVRIEWKEPWVHSDIVDTWQPRGVLSGDLTRYEMRGPHSWNFAPRMPDVSTFSGFLANALKNSMQHMVLAS